MRDIRATLEQADIGLSKFGSSYINAQNKEQPCYHLPRREHFGGFPVSNR